MSVMMTIAEARPQKPAGMSTSRCRSGYTSTRVPWQAERHVLVIDDESGICELLSLYLTQKGLDVATVQRASEAKPLLERGGFDLVILDWKLEGAEGLDLLHLSKSRHPEIPVIIYTGADVSEVPFQSGLMHEADDVVRKMGPLEALSSAIFYHLEPAIHACSAA